MLLKKLHIRKNRKTRPCIAQSDLLISEALEKRQMLDSGPVLNMELLDKAGNVVSEWEQYSYNYSGPWITNAEGLGGQTGGDNLQSEWTATNPASNVRGQFNLDENKIHTITAFRAALESKSVAEVSDDLIGCFAQQDSLYPTNIMRAWAFSSDTLYTLLVLNSRFPGTIDSNGVYRIDSRVNQAIQRVVGFPFNGNFVDATDSYDPAPGPAGDNKPFPNNFEPQAQISVLSTKGTFTTTDGNRTVSFKQLRGEVPTVLNFFKFTNALENGRGNTAIPGVHSIVAPLPFEVFERLEQYYSDAVNREDSIDVFAEISGIENLSHLVLFPNLVKSENNSFVWDAKNTDLIGQAAAVTNLQYGIYQEACEAVGGYYGATDNGSLNTSTQVTRFFNNFAYDRLQIIKAEEQSATPNQTVIDTNINELAIGLRALMAMAYDASPLWTSYGIGFSNAANPMVGESLATVQSPDSFIDLFNGQEIQLDNIYLPGSSKSHGTSPKAYTIPVTPLPPSSTRTSEFFDNYTTNGWFQLNPPGPALSGVQYMTPDNTTPNALPSYKEIYEIASHATAVIFDPTTTSSDTLDASGVSLLSGTYLTPTTTVDINTEPTELRTLHRIVGHPDVLPSEFTTYISLAGGVDRVTGSDFADVIVGPTSEAPHGRLTVNAGPGDDVISPGRGGSLVELGTGADKVIFDHGDLFGIANFLDFQISEGDTLVVSDGIDITWNMKTPDTLILSSAAGTKTLRLTPIGTSGDLQWNPELVQTISTTSGINLGELNYIETHAFIDPAATDLNDYSLRVGYQYDNASNRSRYNMLYDAYRENDGMYVSAGDKTYKYTFKNLKTNHIGFEIPLSAFPIANEENLVISMTPVIQPTDIEQTLVGGKVKTAVTAQQIQSARATGGALSFQIDDVSSNSAIVDYMSNEGASMYLFNNDTKLKLGKVTQLLPGTEGDNTLVMFIDALPAGTSISTGANLMWKAAHLPYDGRQYQVFVDRHDGYENYYDHYMTTDKLTINSSVLNEAIESNKKDYNWISNPPSDVHPKQAPFSKWMPIPNTQSNQIAYMGGLAKFILENNIHTSAQRSTPFPTIEITIDPSSDLYLDAGPGKYNLSSSFSLFQLPAQLPQGETLQTICDALNQQPSDPLGNAGTMLQPMPANTIFLGTQALSTGSQIFVNGSGRINAWQIYTNPVYQGGARNIDSSQGNRHPDWSSNVYYTIGTDILTLSSSYIPKDHDGSIKYAINAFSFSSAWPMIKGIGGVRFQDWDTIARILPSGEVDRGWVGVRKGNPALAFNNSPVQLGGHKQLGGWNEQADGPQVGGWNSYINGSFIHANDDSIKVGAPGLNALDNTVLQGPAGAAVGTSYGYVNGGFNGSVIDGVFVHRVNMPDSKKALVMNWVSPIPEYFHNGEAQDLTVANVFVPSIPQTAFQTDTQTTYQGTVDLNHVATAAALNYQAVPNDFGFHTHSTSPFQLNIGPLDLYENWNIQPPHLGTNYVIVGTQKKKNGSGGTSPTSFYDEFSNISGSWHMYQGPNADTAPQYNNQQFLTDPATGPVVTVTATSPVKIFSHGTVKRPQLKRATKIRINRDSKIIGPQPIRMMHSHIKAAVSSNPGVSDDHSYVITGLASGKVEKKQGESWVDVSTPPKSSNPFELLALLQRRLITSSDEIRWVPDAEDHGEVSTEAFELIGWNGTSASEEKTSIEIDASGWQDF